MSRTYTAYRDKLLKLLTRAAEADEVCPSNNDLAVAIDAQSSATPVRMMQLLEADGLIKVSRFGAGREVTIVATGKKTRWDGARKPHFRQTATSVPTGAELADRLRRAAHERSLSISTFLAPLSSEPTNFIDQLGRALRPRATTIERIEALLDGRPVPPPPPNNFHGPRRAGAPASAGQVHDAAAPDIARPTINRSAEPCFYCETRGGLACRHRPDEGVAL